MNYEIKKISDIRCELGEGLVWDCNSHFLLMTDIINGKLIELDIDSNSHRYWKFSEPLAWVLPTTIENKYLIGLKSGVAIFDTSGHNEMSWVNQDFPGLNHCRLNDACVDSMGRVWYGSMNMLNHASPDGQLASLSALHGLRIHEGGFTVTNGPVVSPDGNFLFLNDTIRGMVYRYRLSMDTGTLSDRQIFIRFEESQGYPDGMSFDVEGNLWIALWGSASVVQLDPTGRLLRKISIPAPNVTNICFCGPRLDRLIVSTASIDLSTEDLLRYPDSGGVFEICGSDSIGIPNYSVNLSNLWN